MSNNKKNIAVKIIVILCIVAVAVLVVISRNYENTSNTQSDALNLSEEEILEVEKKANMTREEIAEEVKMDVKKMLEEKKAE